MAQRVLAVLGAVAIVLAAIVARAAIDDNGGGGAPEDPGDDNQIHLACDTDLEAYCNALTGSSDRFVEASAMTSADIVDGALNEVDAWITSDVWFEVTQGRSEPDIGTAEILATSPVVAAVDPDRAAAVSGLCEGQALWRCLGDHAGEGWAALGGQATWGQLHTGLPDADTSTGLAVLASVAVGHFGNTTFATNEFDASFGTWLSKLAAPAPGGDPDPANTLVVRRGTYSVAGAVEARLSSITRPFEQLPATPVVTASIVLVDLPGGEDVTDVAQQLREALTGSGWTRGSGEPKPLLKPGVTAALHTLWTEVTR